MTYQIWAFTQAEAKAAYLENAFNISSNGRVLDWIEKARVECALCGVCPA